MPLRIRVPSLPLPSIPAGNQPQIFNKSANAITDITGISKTRINNILGVSGWAPTAGPGSQGPNNPSSAAIYSTSDFTWSNLNNILANDGVYATATNNVLEGGTSDDVEVKNFGFLIPEATIDGIEVQMTAYASSNSECTINKCDLYLNATLYGIGGNAFSLTTTPTTYTYGGPTFKWPVDGFNWNNESMTPSIVNNSNFSIVTSVTSNIGDTIYLDNIRVKVYYTT